MDRFANETFLAFSQRRFRFSRNFFGPRGRAEAPSGSSARPAAHGCGVRIAKFGNGIDELAGFGAGFPCFGIGGLNRWFSTSIPQSGGMRIHQPPGRRGIQKHFSADEYFLSIDSKNHRSYIFGSSSI
jgi:hypothetical protein